MQLRPRPAFRDVCIDGFRRLLNAIVIFTCLFVFVRIFALEPFGVPTGSMAATLLGNHREGPCPRCGFPVIVGEPGQRETRSLHDAVCPNCGKTHINLSEAHELPGDRLLVDKNVFNFRSPRRWEVCVFRCPVDDSKPYVKRIIGLPGEAVQLIGGDVYTNNELQRKNLPQCRECLVPVFDQSFAPASGWGPRWLVETLAEPRKPAAPAGPEIFRDGAIVLDATTKETPAIGLTYRNWNLNKQTEEAITDWLGYNGTHSSRGWQQVHDFAVTFEIEVQRGAGQFAIRLFDGLDSVYVELPLGQPGEGTKLGRDGGDPPLQTGLYLDAGKTHRIEFAFIDRRASLAVNGKLLAPSLDLPAEKLDARKGVSQPLQLGVSGAAVTLRNLKIYRDVYLRNDAPNGRQQPWKLAADQYFVVGDNSANSHDSREWATPGVPERSFLGKPFLIHQPLKLGTVSVNGQNRTYQAIDWARLRWVR